MCLWACVYVHVSVRMQSLTVESIRFIYLTSAPDAIATLPSVEEERGSPDAPAEGSEPSQYPTADATGGGSAGDVGVSSEEEEEEEEAGATKRKRVDAETLFGEDSSDSAEGRDTTSVDAAAGGSQPGLLHSQDLFGEADDISS